MKQFLSELLVIIFFVNCVQLEDYVPNTELNLHIIQKCLEEEGLPLNALPWQLCPTDKEKVKACIRSEHLERMKMSSQLYTFKWKKDFDDASAHFKFKNKEHME
ncbi:uncharacterized protein LOC135833472 isoform X1 [Planococcus citri]|uniref:uncharacterized protein LOC135833472 isoform X1 n=1 Tax=Planococcus citri TaxID=170843 RepID=UPI0031F85AE0